MSHLPERVAPPPRAARLAAAGLGGAALAAAVVTLLGWALDVPRLTDWDANGISMFPNTAAAAALAGAALMLLSAGHGRAATVLGGAVALVGAATLFEHISGRNLGIDTLLFPRPWGQRGAAAPNRMGPPASTAFLLLGVGLMLTRGRARARATAVALGLMAAGIALLAIAGYLFGADQLYTVPQLTGIALQSAAILWLLALGLIAAVPDRQPVRALCEDSGAGLLARRGLPFVVGLPVLLGWLGISGRHAGLYDTGMAAAMLVVVLIVLMCLGLWWCVAAVGRRERALAEADRRKDEFVATLAHELRNPLAPLRSSVEILKRAAGDTVVIEEARAVMERQLGQMVRLVDDLLDMGRITRGRLVLQPERVELATIVRDAVDVCRPLAETAGHDLQVDLPPKPIDLHADPVRLAQVFGNLLTNACKYTDGGGRVRIAAERDGDAVVVRVSDTGIGIPPELLPTVFEPFTQIDPAGQGRGGLGIGLTLVKRLVEMHAGTVTAASGGPGRGSEFTVRLPLSKVEARIATDDSPPSSSPAFAAKRVLVVDDNVDAAHSLATLLTLVGHDIKTVHDGPSAVAAAAAYRPDVILLDLGLPTMTGFDACRLIRDQPGGREMAIVALTGWGQDDDRRRSKEAGFDGHLVKPVDHKALLEVIASVAGEG